MRTSINVRAVLFDLMGTLLIGDTGGRGDAAYQQFYATLCSAGLRLSRDAFDEVYRSTRAVAVEPPLTPFADRLVRVCAHGGLRLNDAAAGHLADTVCRFSADLLVLDANARAVLGALRDRIGRIGLVTNYDHPPNIHHLLRREQLAGQLDVVVISGELGIWKPDPRILEHAAAQLAVDPADVVYVGDSAVDVEAAVGAGMTPVLISRASGPADPLREPGTDVAYVSGAGIVIGDLTELLQLLRPARPR